MSTRLLLALKLGGMPPVDASALPPRRTMGEPGGREVRLAAGRCRHIVDAHPELAAYEDEVVRAVESPTHVLPGRESDEAWFYARESGPSRWLKVVVVFDGSARGRIITAFPRRRKP